MSSKELTVVAKTHVTVFEQMPPALQKVATAFEGNIKLAGRAYTLMNYDFGQRLLTVQTDVEEKKAAGEVSPYGDKPLEMLAAYLWPDSKGGVTTLRDLGAMAKVFKREYVNSQLELPRNDGKSLELGHFLAVSRVKSAEQRQELFKKIRLECLTVNSVELLVRAQFERRLENRQGGRKPQVPGNPLAAMQKGFFVAQKMSRYLGSLDGLMTYLQKPDQELDERAFKQLDTFEKELVEAEAQINSTLQGLQKARKHLHAPVPVADKKPAAKKTTQKTLNKSVKKAAKKVVKKAAKKAPPPSAPEVVAPPVEKKKTGKAATPVFED